MYKISLRKTLTALLLLVIVAGIGATLWLQKPARAPAAGPAGVAAALLTAASEGFARTDTPWRFTFPDDHGAHPAYRTESWYFSGNLATRQGQRFGFQLTFFRLALTPEAPQSTSAWAARQVYRGHFSLTDVAQARFHAFERFSRAALGLSGSASSPVRVWLDNWAVEVLADDNDAESPRFQLRASENDFGLDLQLQSAKPMVLPGEGGPFGDGGGANSFYFYLMPRMLAQGNLQLGADAFEVDGFAWLDRAWGEVPVSQGQIALNRFVLQLDDGREIMAFQLRRRDGSAAPVSTGLLVTGDGSVRRLGRLDLAIEELDYWTSPQDGTRYPARWRVRLPAEALELDLLPYVADQELNLAVRYWGGAVRITGKADGQTIGGSGYVELTGYAEGA